MKHIKSPLPTMTQSQKLDLGLMSELKKELKHRHMYKT